MTEILDDEAELADDDEAAEEEHQAADETPQNVYSTVAAFVAGYLSRIYAHHGLDRQTSWHWCPEWWKHPEAVARLEACWRAWEKLRRDPGTGPGVWFRDHADPCMTALTADGGTLSRCTTGHLAPPALPIVEPPPGLFAEPVPAPGPG